LQLRPSNLGGALTRTGKGVGTIIPNPLEYPFACVSNDPKGENTRMRAPVKRDDGGLNLSSQRAVDLRNALVKRPGRCFSAQRFARHAVERCGNSRKPIGVMQAKIGAF